jgi:hypothetical protein
MLRELRLDLQQAAHPLERTLLPARVALQRCEKLRCVDDVYLVCIGCFSLCARLGEEEGEFFQRCLYLRRTEILQVFVVVVEHEEEWAWLPRRLYHIVDAVPQLLQRHILGLAEMIKLGAVKPSIPDDDDERQLTFLYSGI